MTGRLWIAAALGWLCLAVSSPAQSLVEKKKIPLTPQVEQGLAEYRDRCVPEKLKQLTKHMEEVIAAINASAKTTPEEQTALQEKAKAVVDSAIESWKPRFLESLRSWLIAVPEKRALQFIKGWKPDNSGPNEPVDDWTMPDELPAWSDGVKAVLGAERYTTWDKEVSDKQKKRDEKIASYLKTWAEQGRKPVDEDLKTQIEDMTNALKLDASKVAALKKMGQETVDAITAKEEARATKMFRAMTEATRKNMMGRNYFYVSFGGATSGTMQQDWSKAVAGILQPEQVTAWTKWREDQKERDKADLIKDLKVLGGMYKERFVNTLTMDAKKISAALSLPAERAKSLQKAADAAAETYIAKWEAKMLEELLKQPASFRRDVLNHRAGMQVDVPGNDNPREAPSWIKAKDALITAAEQAALKAAAKEHATRAAVSHAMLALSDLDQTVGFSSAQREKIEPLLVALLVKQKNNAVSDDDEDGNSIDLRSLVNEASKLNEQDVKPLLDEAQWKRWQKGVKADPNAAQRRQPDPFKADTTAAKKTEPKSVESVISEHIHNLQERERTTRFASMRVKVEEAARIGGLSPQASARLESAAQGAVEMSLTEWLNSMAGWLRNSLINATPQSIRAQLEGMGTVSFGSGSDPKDNPLWKDTVEEVLPTDARALWNKEQDARESYRYRAIAKTVLAEVNRRAPMTEAQSNKLEPIIAKIAKEYTPDLNEWYSPPWYAYGYIICAPLAGVPEKDMKEIFNPDELKRLNEGVLEQAGQNWSSIKEMHESRLGRRGN
jgi:hypothetical protein